MKYALFVSMILGSCLFLIISCKKDKPVLEEPTGHISFNFNHLIDGAILQKDTMKYTNAAGNPYEINQLMYFISDVRLHKTDGSIKLISDWTDIHYVDIDIPATLKWDVYDKIPAGSYDSISFIFGITKEKNLSFRFVNPPEVNMMWPDILGGGYHYMMINGKWKNNENQVENYAFHLGIGQLYKSNVITIDSIYAFVQNYFSVKLSNSTFSIEENKTRNIEIIMNIESWFDTPHIYDHNYWGGAIMQNQPAMQMIKENGVDVFTFSVIR
jgi:hypothetical protein